MFFPFLRDLLIFKNFCIGYAKRMNEKHPSKFPERPLDCLECKKPIVVVYTEIVGGVVNEVSMCADCPELRRRLYGGGGVGDEMMVVGSSGGVACGNCGTTLGAVRMGARLGCSVCYEVFADFLMGELLSSGRLPERLKGAKKSNPIHIGRSPGEVQQEINPALRLLALNDALSETLKREDYEQAAQLRDQIRALTEETETKGEQPPKSK